MHTTNFVGKTYTIQVDYETTLGTRLHILIRTEKKHSRNRVFVFLDPRPWALILGPLPQKFCKTKYNTTV